jgi:hypothetical protein
MIASEPANQAGWEAEQKRPDESGLFVFRLQQLFFVFV